METAQLKDRLAKLETELDQARSVTSETQAQLEEQRQQAGELERELKNFNLQCQLEKHDTLDTLREEHKRALEREQRQADEERRRVDVCKADLKKGFEIEKRQLEQKLADIEPRVPSPEVEDRVPTATEGLEITATTRTVSDT